MAHYLSSSPEVHIFVQSEAAADVKNKLPTVDSCCQTSESWIFKTSMVADLEVKLQTKEQEVYELRKVIVKKDAKIKSLEQMLTKCKPFTVEGVVKCQKGIKIYLDITLASRI